MPSASATAPQDAPAAGPRVDGPPPGAVMPFPRTMDAVPQSGHLLRIAESWDMAALTVRTVSASAVLSAPVLIVVAGDIDIASAPQLRRHLENLCNRDVVLDMSGVTLLAAAGLHVLLDLEERLGRTGAHLVLAAPAAQVRRVLAATGLDETLAAASSVADAVRRPAPNDAPSPSRHLRNGVRHIRLRH